MIIDDFTSGAVEKIELTKGVVRKHQTGTMIGGQRLLSFEVINHHESAPGVADQEGSLAIGAGACLVGNNVFAFHRFLITYGITEASQSAALHADFSKAGRFVMHFDVLDKTLNINVQLFASSGTVRIQKGINAPARSPSTVNFPLSEFEPKGQDLHDVAAITVVIQDGSQGGGADYAIRRFEVV